MTLKSRQQSRVRDNPGQVIAIAENVDRDYLGIGGTENYVIVGVVYLLASDYSSWIPPLGYLFTSPVALRKPPTPLHRRIPPGAY